MISLGVYSFDKVENVILHSRYNDNQYKITWFNEKCGLWSCDENKPLLSCKYDSVSPVVVRDEEIGEYTDYFKIGFADESDGNIRYGIFDVKRRCFIISCEYWVDPIISLNRVFGFLVTNIDRYKIGVLDTDGKIICPMIFDGHKELHPFRDSRPVQKQILRVSDQDWQGKPLESLYFILKTQTGYQIINERGDALSKPCYSYVRMVDTGKHQHSEYGGWSHRDILFIVLSDGKYGVLSETGKEVFPCIYDGIEYSQQMDVLTLKQGNEFFVQRIEHDSLLD